MILLIFENDNTYFVEQVFQIEWNKHSFVILTQEIQVSWKNAVKCQSDRQELGECQETIHNNEYQTSD